MSPGGMQFEIHKVHRLGFANPEPRVARWDSRKNRTPKTPKQMRSFCRPLERLVRFGQLVWRQSRRNDFIARFGDQCPRSTCIFGNESLGTRLVSGDAQIGRASCRERV